MTRASRMDGFEVFSGVLAVVGTPVMLAAGAPAGWSFLILACGIIVLLAQAMIVYRIEFEIWGWPHVLVAATGVTCVGIAVVYLTRAANDLPRLFPGHDGDSEQFRIVPGLLALTLGSVVLARAIAATHPRRTDPHVS